MVIAFRSWVQLESQRPVARPTQVVFAEATRFLRIQRNAESAIDCEIPSCIRNRMEVV